jgi:hypothetical protein
MRAVSLLLVGSLVLACAGQASADTIWGNTATFGPVQLAEFDTVTGAKLTEFTVSATGNGRGIVVVGDILYWTMVGDANIYKTDKNTGLSLGSILTSNGSMSTIAWDGSYFWTSDYSGSNEAYKIDPVTGLNVDTINLSLAGSNMDGMEFFFDGLGNPRLIANRGDAQGPYDIYDTAGGLITANFITPTFQPTGIAYDGTNFFVSDIFSQSMSVYSGTNGSLIRSFNYDPFSGPYSLIEDLSFDYTVTLPPPPPVPEPGTMALLGLGALAGIVRRRVRAVKR